MNRTSLGIIAIVLLALGGIAMTRGPANCSAAGFAGGCIRVGLVLGALWLALPQLLRFLSRTPKWLLAACGIGVVVCAVKPVLLIAVVPLLGLLWFFGPRTRAPSDQPMIAAKRPRRRSHTR
jgi:hypothetical protein